MSEPQNISINDVRQAVRAALAESFPDVPVLDGEPPEETSPPYFIVQLLESGHVQELGRRFMRQYPFSIRYVDPDAENEDRYDMADHLSDALQWIDVAGRPVRGTEMKFKIENQILHFSVEYRIRVWKPVQPDPAMQSLDLKEGIK
jgi:hypothetical protein